MKRLIFILTFLVALVAKAAQPLHFNAPSGFIVYNPYKWNEIEIKEFRGQNEKPVADWIKKAGYPLIRKGGPNGEKNPYVEVDMNGHKAHRYRRFIYEPRLFKKPKKVANTKWVDTNDDGIYEAPPKVKLESEPLVVKSGLHKGKRLDRLVIVYEKMPGHAEWMCYDAYWVWSAAARPRVLSIPGMGSPRPIPSNKIKEYTDKDNWK